MNKLKVFYPVGIENIWHLSADGKRKYRLDSIEKIARLKKTLESEDRLEIVNVNDGDPAAWELVHTPKYTSALITGHPPELANSSGIMWQPEFPKAYANSARAMSLACQEAFLHKAAVTLGKGGHHTLPDYGQGFGPVNEVAIAIKQLHQSAFDLKVAILDVDVHIGNGWQTILSKEPNTLLVDLWNKTIPRWTAVKPANNVLSIQVDNAAEYMTKLAYSLNVIHDFQPDLLIYHCGLDVLSSDRLGGIPGFNKAILWEREQLVAHFVRQHDIPIVFITGGGYINHQDEIVAEKDFAELVKLYKEIILNLQSLVDVSPKLL